MAKRNDFDKDGSAFILGENAENSFEASLKLKGISFVKTGKKDEIRHIDYFLELKSEGFVGVDVKSMKKIKRKDKDVNEALIWVEFKNVLGFDGWLFGAADYIAFERKDDFLVVRRESLANFCLSRVDFSRKNKRKVPLYTTYTRYGRKDLLSVVRMDDIMDSIKYKILPKQ